MSTDLQVSMITRGSVDVDKVLAILAVCLLKQTRPRPCAEKDSQAQAEADKHLHHEFGG